MKKRKKLPKTKSGVRRMDMSGRQQQQTQRVVPDRIPMWQSSPYFLLTIWNFVISSFMLTGCAFVIYSLDYDDIDALPGGIIMVFIVLICTTLISVIGKNYYRLQEQDKMEREMKYKEIEAKATNISMQFQVIQERYGDLQEKYLELQKQLSHEEIQ